VRRARHLFFGCGPVPGVVSARRQGADTTSECRALGPVCRSIPPPTVPTAPRGTARRAGPSPAIPTSWTRGRPRRVAAYRLRLAAIRSCFTLTFRWICVRRRTTSSAPGCSLGAARAPGADSSPVGTRRTPAGCSNPDRKKILKSKGNVFPDAPPRSTGRTCALLGRHGRPGPDTAFDPGLYEGGPRLANQESQRIEVRADERASVAPSPQSERDNLARHHRRCRSGDAGGILRRWSTRLRSVRSVLLRRVLQRNRTFSGASCDDLLELVKGALPAKQSPAAPPSPERFSHRRPVGGFFVEKHASAVSRRSAVRHQRCGRGGARASGNHGGVASAKAGRSLLAYEQRRDRTRTQAVYESLNA